jgi:glycosyltransferase involved in cell wall biosynthesis
MNANCEFHPRDLLGIKIARISTVPFFLVSQLRGQVEYLSNLGMNVVLISSSGPELAQLNLSANLNHKTIELPRNLNIFFDFIALVKLFFLFRKEKFAIVHSTTPKAGMLSAIASFVARVPVRLHTFTGQPWVTMRNPLRFAARACDKLIGLLNTKCYADSESQRQFLIDEHIVSSDRISVIGKGSLAGVDVKRFSAERYRPEERQQLRKELCISPDSTVLVFVGRITNDKGIRELLSAFRRVVCLGYNIDLLLVGPSDSECGGTRTTLTTELKSIPRLRLIGYTETPERFLSVANLLCLPSYREGFGTVVIEAASMGVPTLGTEINGLIDAIEHGKTGLLVAPRNEDALFEGLLSLLNSPQMMQTMGCLALKRCHEYFNSTVVNGKLANEYASCLKKAGIKPILR